METTDPVNEFTLKSSAELAESANFAGYAWETPMSVKWLAVFDQEPFYLKPHFTTTIQFPFPDCPSLRNLPAISCFSNKLPSPPLLHNSYGAIRFGSVSPENPLM
jgi:hypothetical protein